MVTGLLLFSLIARHGHAIEQLKRDMIAEEWKDDLVRFLAYDTANFVYAFLAASGNSVSPTDRTLRDEVMHAILKILDDHGIDSDSFQVWPTITS